MFIQDAPLLKTLKIVERWVAVQAAAWPALWGACHTAAEAEARYIDCLKNELKACHGAR